MAKNSTIEWTATPWTDPALIKRFFKKVVKSSPDECWEWQAADTGRSGYGIFFVEGRLTTAHRVSYAIEHGYEPEGLVIDHLCRNRKCVNPAHLEAVTYKENVQRGAKGRLVTSCCHGHPYTPENTGHHSDGRRFCHKCRRIRDRRRRDAAYWRDWRKRRKERTDGQKH